MQICFDTSQNWKFPLRPFVKSGATVFIISKHLWKFPHSIPFLPCPLGRPTLLRLCGCLQDAAEQGDVCSSHPLSHAGFGRYLLLFWKCTLLCFMKFWLSYVAAIVLALLVGTHFVFPIYSAGTVAQGVSPHGMTSVFQHLHSWTSFCSHGSNNPWNVAFTSQQQSSSFLTEPSEKKNIHFSVL